MSLSARDSNVSSKAIHRGLDAELNSIILERFFCGMYTVLFGYTLNRLVRTPNKKIYTLVLFILWALVITTFSFDWILQRSVLVYLGNIFSALCTVLADVVMIWRCFTLWEHKKWVLSPLLAALIANTIIACLIFVVPPDVVLREYVAALNNLIIAFFMLNVGITAIGTFLIILRILLVTQQSPASPHQKAYRKVQVIVLESGIIYSIAILVSAITFAIQTYAHLTSDTTTQVITGYSGSLLTPLSGIGPTLIAARIGAGTEERKPDETRPLTHLTFKRTTRQDNTAEFEDESDKSGPYSHSGQIRPPTQQTVDSDMVDRSVEMIV